MTRSVSIANVSGFYGDRISAMREMLEGGELDVLTGDWLAELTMLILARTRASRPGGGYARTFVRQMEQVMGTCLDRGIKVVANAGGLDPDGCAEAVAEVAGKLGLSPTIAYVSGDDLLRNADSALHQAKQEGRNTFRFYTQGLTDQAHTRLTLEGQLRQALKHNEFVLHFQPLVRASDGRANAAAATAATATAPRNRNSIT